MTKVHSLTLILRGLLDLWASFQSEVGDAMGGPLYGVVTHAGAGINKLQGRRTKHREQKRLSELDVTVRALPEEDMRRITWLNLDKKKT